LGSFYQQKLADLDASYRRGDVREAREALEEIWPHLERVFAWCAENQASSQAAAVLADKLAGVAGNLFETFLTSARAIEWRETALFAVDGLLAEGSLSEPLERELAHDRVSHLTYLAIAHLRNGHLDRGRALCEEALRATTAADQAHERAAALVHLAMIDLDVDPSVARARVDEARALVGDEDSEIRATIETIDGALASRDQAPDRAIEHRRRAVQIYRGLGHLAAEATALTNLAGDLLAFGAVGAVGTVGAVGAVGEASQAVDRALELAAQVGDAKLRGLAQVRRAQIWQVQTPASPEIVSEYEGALELFLEAGDRLNARKVAGLLASVYASAAEAKGSNAETRIEARRREVRMADVLGDPARKETALERLLEEAKAHEDHVSAMWALGQLGRHRFLEGAYEEAVADLEAALEALERSRPGRTVEELAQNEGELRNLLGQAYRHLGRSKEAADQLREALRLVTDDEDARLRALGNLALALVHDDDHRDEARRQLRTIREAYRARGDVRLMGHAWFNEAYGSYLAGDVTEAIEQGERAVEVLRRINDVEGLRTVEPQLEKWKQSQTD
jgi:tetratricopeptide (TPR) repeat protein